MRTVSPILHSLASSCAAYFFERRMNFLYSGCITRRSTRTVTVLSILSLVTLPVRTRLGIPVIPSGRGGGFLFRQNGFHTRDIAPYDAHPGHTLGLAGGALEA